MPIRVHTSETSSHPIDMKNNMCCYISIVVKIDGKRCYPVPGKYHYCMCNSFRFMSIFVTPCIFSIKSLGSFQTYFCYVLQYSVRLTFISFRCVLCEKSTGSV
jgi:hypothetical protein